MDAYLEQVYLNNPLREWLISLSIIIGVIIASRILMWLFERVFKNLTRKTQTRLDDIVMERLRDPIVLFLTLWASWYGFERLHFSVDVDSWISGGFSFILTLSVAWLLVRLLNALVQEYLVPYVEKSESDYDDQLLPLVQKLVIIIIWSIGFLLALNNAGYDVGALIAGLGIGGLAFALAAKDTLSNFFGGITILTDKPFKLYDRVKIGGFDGTIVEIGIRSTRLRTLEGRVVTIPNSTFTDGLVENVSLEPSRKVSMSIGLVYDTTAEQMQEAMDVLAEIHAEIPYLDTTRYIAFTSFGDFSLGITYIYYIKKGEDIFKVQSLVNMEILKRFNQRGLEMAFPTQTVYTKKG